MIKDNPKIENLKAKRWFRRISLQKNKRIKTSIYSFCIDYIKDKDFYTSN